MTTCFDYVNQHNRFPTKDNVQCDYCNQVTFCLIFPCNSIEGHDFMCVPCWCQSLYLFFSRPRPLNPTDNAPTSAPCVMLCHKCDTEIPITRDALIYVHNSFEYVFQNQPQLVTDLFKSTHKLLDHTVRFFKIDDSDKVKDLDIITEFELMRSVLISTLQGTNAELLFRRSSA